MIGSSSFVLRHQGENATALSWTSSVWGGALMKTNGKSVTTGPYYGSFGYSLLVCQSPVTLGVYVSLMELKCLLNSTRPSGHIDKDHDDQHHHSQCREDYSGHLLSRFLHGQLTILLILGCFFLGFAFKLPHDVSAPACSTSSLYLQNLKEK